MTLQTYGCCSPSTPDDSSSSSSAHKQALLCVSFGDRPWASTVRVSHERYAAWHGLEYLFVEDVAACRLIKELPFELDGVPPAVYQSIVQLCKLDVAATALLSYERIVLADDTYLFAAHAPSLLKEVPRDRLGVYVEGERLGRNFHPAPRKTLPTLQLAKGGVLLSYAFNTGLLVLSAAAGHRALLTWPSVPWLQQHYSALHDDQEYLNYAAYVARAPLHRLSVSWGACPAMFYFGESTNRALFPCELHAFHVTSFLSTSFLSTSFISAGGGNHTSDVAKAERVAYIRWMDEVLHKAGDVSRASGAWWTQRLLICLQRAILAISCCNHDQESRAADRARLGWRLFFAILRWRGFDVAPTASQLPSLK